MRVAMIVNAFPEISQKFILNQVTGLLDAGVEVDVYAAMKPKEAKSHEIAERYGLAARTTYANVPRSSMARVLGLPGLFFRQFFAHPGAALRAFRYGRYGTASRNLKTLYFLEAFGDSRYDVIHCQFGPNGLVGAFLKDCGIAGRLVVTFHGSDITTYPSRYGEGIYRVMYDRADAVTSGTSFTKAKLTANSCPETKITVIPVGVRMDEYAETDFASREPFSILSVGRLVEVKGYRWAIEAFAKVHERFPRAEYLIVGDGGLKASLEALAGELGVAGSVRFLGAMRDTEVAALYRTASVFVLPSVIASDGAEEGQGLVLQEAQACGLPVVSTRIGGIPEGVIEGETGFIVAQKDPAAMAERICLLLGNPELRKQMGVAGRAFASARYDVPVLTKKLIELYGRVVS
jgi:colanic acid/amylovoran biosynthesis glycosyltransferase